jgi:hypothetical protein
LLQLPTAPSPPPCSAFALPTLHRTSAMGDNGSNNDDVKAAVTSLTETLKSLQTAVESNSQVIQCLYALRPPSSSSSAKPMLGEHHNDHPPYFQRMDFLKFDGKSDPLAFINRCDSYFYQQRIMEVWMASYNLEEVAQLWYIQVQ